MSYDLKGLVEDLARPDGREVGSPGHRWARERLLEEMRTVGLEGIEGPSFEHPYAVEGEEFCNVLGMVPGGRPELDPVLLAAHYDTCGPLPGADDNAAAVAILFSIVPRIRAAKLDRSVVFAFFDAEEPPYFLSPAMGSIWYYRNQRKGEIHCAVVLDLVGHDVPIPSFSDVLFVTGMESDPGLEAVFREASGVSGIRPLPTLTRNVGDMSDYHAFRVDGKPYLFLSCGQWPHYHRATDTPDKLNYEKMKGVAEFVEALARGAAGAELSGPFEGYDTTPTEIEYFSKYAGTLLRELELSLDSRADLDRLARHIVTSYGLLQG